MRLDRFVGGFYTAQSPNADPEEAINVFAEPMEVSDGKNSNTLYRRPGYNLFLHPSGLIIAQCPVVQPVYGIAYSFTLQALGGAGEPPYTWAITDGALPDGLTLDAETGEISGTPTATGTFSWTATVTDSSDPALTASIPCQSVVSAAELAIVACPTGPLTVGTPFSFTFEAIGGVPPYTWEVFDGALPTGLTLDPSTGEMYGTPTTEGDYFYTIQVTDDQGNTAQIECSLTVNSADVCEPWTTTLPGDGDPVRSVAEGIAVDADYTFVAATESESGTQSWKVHKIDNADGSILATVTMSGTNGSSTINGLAQDDTYVYVFMYLRTGSDVALEIRRINKTTFATYDTKQVYYSNSGTFANAVSWYIAVNGAYIYTTYRDDSLTGYIARVLRSDFTTLSSLSLGATTNAAFMAFDGTYVYITGDDNVVANDEFALFRVAVSSFAAYSKLVVDVGESISGFQTYIPIGYSDGTLYCATYGDYTNVVTIDTGTFTQLGVQDITLSAYEAASLAIDSDGTYIYIVGSNPSGWLLRVSAANVSVYALETLPQASGTFVALDPDNHIFYTGQLTTGTLNDQAVKLCEFMPD